MKTPPIFKILSLPSVIVASVCSLNAALIYEPFEQNTGALGGQTGGTGLSPNTWSTPQNASGSQILSGSMSFGSLPTAGNRIGVTSSGRGTDGEIMVTSVLSDAGLLANGGTLWFSLLIQEDIRNNGHSGFAFGTDGLNGAFNGAFMNNSGNGMGFYFRHSLGAVATSWQGGSRTANGAQIDISSNQTLIVGELIWGAGTDTLNLYAPSSSDISDKGSVLSTYTTAGNLDQSAFDTISYTLRGDGNVTPMDEIRFGASYDEVIGVVAAPPIPEPSAALLGALGGFLLLYRRK